jgi:hypothetical protein
MKVMQFTLMTLVALMSNLSQGQTQSDCSVHLNDLQRGDKLTMRGSALSGKSVSNSQYYNGDLRLHDGSYQSAMSDSGWTYFASLFAENIPARTGIRFDRTTDLEFVERVSFGADHYMRFKSKHRTYRIDCSVSDCDEAYRLEFQKLGIEIVTKRCEQFLPATFQDPVQESDSASTAI